MLPREYIAKLEAYTAAIDAQAPAATKVKKEVVSALRLHALCIARLCRG